MTDQGDELGVPARAARPTGVEPGPATMVGGCSLESVTVSGSLAGTMLQTLDIHSACPYTCPYEP